MRAPRSVMITAALLVAAFLPIVAAMPTEPTPPALDPSQRVPVAIAQPLAMDAGILAIPWTPGPARLPESGMLVLVGTALMGLAAIVRKTTNRHL